MQLATSSWCRGGRFFGAFFVALPATRVGRFVCLGEFWILRYFHEGEGWRGCEGFGSEQRSSFFFWFPGFGVENHHGG